MVTIKLGISTFFINKLSFQDFILFPDRPPGSYAQRLKLDFHKLPKQQSQLKNEIDSVLEADDFMEFSRLIDTVIEFLYLPKTIIQGVLL